VIVVRFLFAAIITHDVTIVLADALYWRRLPESGVRAIFSAWNGEGGSVQEHIKLPEDKHDLAEFFGYNGDIHSSSSITINPVPLDGYPNSDTEIRIDYNPSRGEWYVASEYVDYPLWSAENGFMPDGDELLDDDNNLVADNPPIIYFVRDQQRRFHPRILWDSSDERLEEFSSQIGRTIGGGASGIINLEPRDA